MLATVERRAETMTNDDGFPTWTIVVDVEPDVWRQSDGRPGVAQFRLYEVDSVSLPDGDPCYWRAGSRSNRDVTPDPAEAEADASGFVKWDGCVNWQAEGFLHACDLEEVQRFGAALARAYEIALDLVGGGD